MALRGISTPVDNEVSPLFDFAERAGNFAPQLGGDFGGPVSQRGVTVEQSPELIRERRAFFLRLAGRVAHAVNKRHVGFPEMLGGGLD